MSLPSSPTPSASTAASSPTQSPTAQVAPAGRQRVLCPAGYFPAPPRPGTRQPLFAYVTFAPATPFSTKEGR